MKRFLINFYALLQKYIFSRKLSHFISIFKSGQWLSRPLSRYVRELFTEGVLHGCLCDTILYYHHIYKNNHNFSSVCTSFRFVHTWGHFSLVEAPYSKHWPA